MAERCKAQKTNGQPCPNPARASGFCFAHDPAAGGQRAEARRRGGRHSHTRHSDAPMPPADVRSLDDVRALLGYALAECIMGDNSIPRGRLLVAIAAAYLEVIRTGEFESRLCGDRASIGTQGGAMTITLSRLKHAEAAAAARRAAEDAARLERSTPDPL